MKLALTGGTGFIGSELIRLAPNFGATTLNLPRGLTVAEISDALARFRPNAVVHLAAVLKSAETDANIEALCESNLGFGMKLLQGMADAGVKKLVVCGSYWQDHEAIGVPSNVYAATKNAFEQLVKYYCVAEDFSVLSLRLYDCIGSGDSREKLFPMLYRAMLAEASIPAQIDLTSGEQKTFLLHVSDTASGLSHAAAMVKKQSPATSVVYELRNEGPVSIREAVEYFASFAPGKFALNWGKRPSRPREVLNPQQFYPALPGWSPQFSWRGALEELAKSVR